MVNKNQSLELAGFSLFSGANFLGLASEYLIFFGVSRQVIPQALRYTLRYAL